MSEFMSVSDAKVQELSERLSRTMFKNPEFFVNMYNSGLINKKHEDVSQIAAEMVATFKNIREQNRTLIFLSRQEVFLNEIVETLEDRSVEVHVKREIDSLLSNGSVKNESVIAFSKESIGHVFVASSNEEGGITLTNVSTNRAFTRSEQIQPLYERVSSVKNDEQARKEVFFFRVSDLTGIDVSWIDRMHELLPR